MSVNRRITLVRRPVGMPTHDDFEMQEAPIPEPGDGEVLLRNRYISLDPAIRGWMSEGASYMKPIPLGGVIRSGLVGEVLRSNNPELESGDRIVALGGWEDYSVISPERVSRIVPADSPFPLSNQLSVLGGNGLTAYFGLLEVGVPQEGETVVVSAAAGGVGSIVGQIAKLQGCRVVGIAGSDEKCQWVVEELGFDAAINYKTTPSLVNELKTTCRKGIDVYFDNVGGAVLDACLMRINVGARVVLCGAISQINATEPPPGPSNYIRLLTRRARMEGFVTMDFASRWSEASAQLGLWLLGGKVKHREEIVEGLENAPEALLGLFNGTNLGKLMVCVS